MTEEEINQKLEEMEHIIVLVAIVALGPPKIADAIFQAELNKYLEARGVLAQYVKDTIAEARAEK